MSELGFRVTVPDLAFEHDQKWDDGVALIKSLTTAAEKAGVAFNLKLTNTLETLNQDQNLPDNEQMIYMSGRALHPISINLAAKLQEEFGGGLDISFSAGVDLFNFAGTLACGLRPVTICSDILKPGGYGRLTQYLQAASEAIKQAGAASLDEYILAAGGGSDLAGAALNSLKSYAAKVLTNPRHQKAAYPFDSIKYERGLPLFDCAAAPCMAQCPAHQDVPRYLDYASRGEWKPAYQTVLATNPFPNVQGKVCDHRCQTKCTRLNYDDPLLIREIKRVIAEKHPGPSGLDPAPDNGVKVAIIGAGPSGLACAHFLALEGFAVDVFEAKSVLGGMASDAIPAFRLDDGALETDITAIMDLGVMIHPGERIDSARFDGLLKSHDFIYIAVGAQNSIWLNIPGMDSEHVFDQLSFLSAVRRGAPPQLGKHVAVIGGGNSAMDAARAAKRLVGRKGAGQHRLPPHPERDARRPRRGAGRLGRGCGAFGVVRSRASTDRTRQAQRPGLLPYGVGRIGFQRTSPSGQGGRL
jgi:putative selenate reductase